MLAPRTVPTPMVRSLTGSETPVSTKPSTYRPECGGPASFGRFGIIEPCTANERRASNGSPDFQAPAGITRSLAMQTSIVLTHEPATAYGMLQEATCEELPRASLCPPNRHLRISRCPVAGPSHASPDSPATRCAPTSAVREDGRISGHGAGRSLSGSSDSSQI